jgi:O-antigen ligase
MRQPLIGSSPSGSLLGRVAARGNPSISAGVSAGILYAALAFPPFLFGSREPATVAAWCALLGFGVLIAPLGRLERGHRIVLCVTALVVSCFAFVLHEQLAERPWLASYNPIWAKASAVLGQPIAPSVSIVREQPLFALGAPLANVLALLLGLIVGVDFTRARRGARVMAWAGVGYAVYGIWISVSGLQEILWREKTAYIGSLTATFINRNTAGTYFGSCAAVWLVLLMAAIRRQLPPGQIDWKMVHHHLLVGKHGDVIVRFVAFFICIAALFMTNSRGGVLISLATMILGFVIFFARDLSWWGLAVAVAGCAVVGLLLMFAFGGTLSARIDVNGLSDAGRISAYRSTLRIISDNPWFGTGLGTFASAFPAYRRDDISIWGIWDIAHSTPLEFASELGLPMTAVVGVAWAAAFVLLLRASRGQRIAVPLSAVLVSFIAMLHSMIDFSLQISGYSIVVFALLGVGLSQALRPASPGQSGPRRRSRVPGAVSVNSNAS